MPMCTYINVKR